MKKFLSKISILGEFLAFLWKQKLWWLIPLIVLLLLIGFLLLFAQSSAIAPFIYSLF
ncbi:MAG: DUF5989 family protein [Candidatus Aminicenantales bacterium]